MAKGNINCVEGITMYGSIQASFMVSWQQMHIRRGKKEANVKFGNLG